MLCNLLWPCFIIRQFAATKLLKIFSPSSSDYWSPLQICSAMCGFVHCAEMEKISAFAVGFSLSSMWAVGWVLCMFPKKEQREKYIPNMSASAACRLQQEITEVRSFSPRIVLWVFISPICTVVGMRVIACPHIKVQCHEKTLVTLLSRGVALNLSKHETKLYFGSCAYLVQ